MVFNIFNFCFYFLIKRGTILNEEIEIVGIKPTTKTTVTGIEMFNKTLNEGMAGDNAGILLRGLKKEDITRGQVLAKPGTVKPHTDFECEVYILKKEEGGRHTPFFNGYKPQFYVRTTDVTGDVTLAAGTEMVMPGDTVKLNVKLVTPVALEDQTRFAIREGGRTVGAGVVTNNLGGTVVFSGGASANASPITNNGTFNINASSTNTGIITNNTRIEKGLGSYFHQILQKLWLVSKCNWSA